MNIHTKQDLHRFVGRNVTNIALAARADQILLSLFAIAEKQHLTRLRRSGRGMAVELPRLVQALTVISGRPVASRDVIGMRFESIVQKPSFYARSAACVEANDEFACDLATQLDRLTCVSGEDRAQALRLASVAVAEAYASGDNDRRWCKAMMLNARYAIALLLVSAIGSNEEKFNAAATLVELLPNVLVVGRHSQERSWVAVFG